MSRAGETGARIAGLERTVAALEAERKATADLLDFVAHELMTPVTSLEAFSYILGREARFASDPTAGRCIEGITRNTARLVALVDEMLEIGRLRVGRLQVERRPFDLCDLARAEALRAAAGKEGPKVEAAPASEPIEVLADRARLEQLVAEMVRDCASRSPEGAPVGVVVAKAGARGRVEVSDRGPPLPKDRLEGGFLGLRRTADGVPAGARGGLGLTVGREVVTQLGGAIGASSSASGNVLWFEIPLGGAIPSSSR